MSLEPTNDGPVRMFGEAWTRWPTRPIPAQADLLRAAVAQARQALGPGAEPAAVQEAALRRVMELHGKREAAIAAEQNDPLGCGWESPPMRTVRALFAGTYVDATGKRHQADDVLLLGGNRSGKTQCGGKLVIEELVRQSAALVRCFSQNTTTSRSEQQPMLVRHLPPHLRKVKKLPGDQHTKISYTQATGFTENTFVLPNRSQCFLFTYQQWSQDSTSVEGGEADLIWCDEETPGALLETLRFRTGRKRMRLLVTFTPVHGYTAAVGHYIEGAEILATLPARRVVWDWERDTYGWGDWLLDADHELVRGCPPGHVPHVIQSVVPGRYAVTFPSAFNPYIHLDDILKKAEGSTLEVKLMRWFGWPTRQNAPAFARFSPVHLVEPDRVPPLDEMTVYQFTDPHGQRNWFALWLGVTADGTVFAFQEWPPAHFGEWALPGDKPDGKVGPAQRHEAGRAFNDYKREFLLAEGWQSEARSHGQVALTKPAGKPVLTVFERRMDPRPAGTSVPSDETSKTYLDYMSEPVTDSAGQVLVPGLDFLAADHCGLEDGTQLINDWLTRGWDDQRPVDPLNCPKFYVSKRCPNLIYALRTWTGLDGEKGASKDPIDCLKGAAKLGLTHYAKDFKWDEGRGWR